MTNDLTKGTVFKKILLFSIPFLLGNMFQQLYNVVDMVIVGRAIDSTAYAAVGSTGSLVWFASGAVQFLTAGLSVITAQNFGKGDIEGVKKSFAQSIKIAAIVSVFLAVLTVIFARPMLELLKTPDDLVERAYKYIVWIFAGLVATALYNILSNMLRALGDSKSSLYFLVIACGINIVLDILFIAAFKMDTDGAGLATVIAQLISGICCIFYIKKKHPHLHLEKRHFARDTSLVKSLLKVAIPMMFLNMVLSVGGIAVQFATNSLGTNYVLAQTTAYKVENFVTLPLFAFGPTVSMFVAQNYGAGKYDRVIEGTRAVMLIDIIWCVFSVIAMYFLGKPLVRLLAGDIPQDVVENAFIYIMIIVGTSIILAAVHVYKCMLQAIGRTFWTTVSGFSEILGRAGVSFLALALMAAGTITEYQAFIMICFAGPAAWLLGYLTFLPEYLIISKKFRKGSL